MLHQTEKLLPTSENMMEICMTSKLSQFQHNQPYLIKLFVVALKMAQLADKTQFLLPMAIISGLKWEET